MGKYEEKIPEIREGIVKEINPEKVVLFGSYAWGTPTADSDVDLFIVKDTQKNIFERNREVGRIVFGNKIAIDVLVYTPKQLERREKMGDPFVRKIIGTGKIVYEQQG